MQFVKRGHDVLAPFHGGLDGVWKPLFENDKMICPLVRVPITGNVHACKPYQVVETFKDMCAPGKFLQLFNSAIDMTVSEEQGNGDTDLIKRMVTFMKFIMTAKEACDELQERVSTITTPRNNGGASIQLHWSSSIQANNKMQPIEQKAHKELEQEIQIHGQPIISFARQDSVTPVAGSWSATVSLCEAQDMAA